MSPTLSHPREAHKTASKFHQETFTEGFPSKYILPHSVCIAQTPSPVLSDRDRRSARTSLHRDHHHQRGHRHSKRYKRHQHNSPPTRRKLAFYYPMLRRQISLVSQEQNQDANAQKCRSEGLAHMAQPLGLLTVVRQRGVEPEELRDGDANRRKRQRCPEPRQKGPLCTAVCQYCIRRLELRTRVPYLARGGLGPHCPYSLAQCSESSRVSPSIPYRTASPADRQCRRAGPCLVWARRGRGTMSSCWRPSSSFAERRSSAWGSGS